MSWRKKLEENLEHGVHSTQIDYDAIVFANSQFEGEAQTYRVDILGHLVVKEVPENRVNNYLNEFDVDPNSNMWR